MADENELEEEVPSQAPVQPLYQIFEQSRIAVGKHVGLMWKQRVEAAKKAYQSITDVWDEVFRYYNNNQSKTLTTPRGVFRRGDGTENVIFSNLNVMLPAVYSRDPDVTCSTIDKKDEPFCRALEALVNQLFKRRNRLNAKPKIKKAVGMGLLTNSGILKLEFTKKDDSREYALSEMQRITDEMKKTEDIQMAERLYGELEALEMNLEVLKPSGPGLTNVLPHNLIIDPYAEMPDGSDAQWMAEIVHINTAALNARYTKKKKDDRVLIYKPTHKAVFAPGAGGDRDDGLGMVMEALSGKESEATVTGHTEDERTAYLNMYYTECYMVWDRATRRVFLFHRDDWNWPLWVWDDPLGITRFFPYFIIGYSMSTGGAVCVGETAYIIDQQDELNDINRQMSRIRRTIFDYWFYNADATNHDEIEKFVDAIRGVTQSSKHVIGIRSGERKVSEMLEAIVPPSLDYEILFNKERPIDAVNRITNTSDALRGVQFKTNTNVASVNSYQESMRLSVGAKVDVVEDAVADIAIALAELCAVHFDQEMVAGLIGDELAKGWQQMSVDDFNSQYTLEVVAGSMEKPNSVFKKKEAVEVAQAVGQFARAAPGAALRIILRVLEQAFTEVVIKKEDWDALDAEVAAATQKGVSTPQGAGSPQDLAAAARSLPPEVKQRVMQMREQGAPDQQILAYIQQQVRGQGNAQRPEPARQ